MPFKITITEVKEKTTKKEGEYTLIERRPYTPDEIEGYLKSDHATWFDEGQKTKRAAELSAALKEIRGYSPAREVTEPVEVKVLEQTVEEMDLIAVIKAVNGIAPTPPISLRGR